MLRYDYGGDIRCEFRAYFIERSEVLDDLEYMEIEGVKFWTENVEKDREPFLILPEL
jgi:hypothetical protein